MDDVNEDHLIPATSRPIRRKVTVSVSRRSNGSIQQHRHAVSDTLADIADVHSPHKFLLLGCMPAVCRCLQSEHASRTAH